VGERLACLCREAGREFAFRVPAHHAAHEHHVPARLDAVGIALRARPSDRLQDLVRGTRGARCAVHSVILHDASFCGPCCASRRSSKRWSLPVCVRGNAVTYSMARGYLNGAIVAFTCSCSAQVNVASPAWPGRSTTYAFTI